MMDPVPLPPGVELPPEARDRLARFVEIARERGRTLNLVSAGDADRFADRHVYDSLTAVPLIAWEGKRVVDIGTGAGLPGIPLAIALPETRFILVERTRKRVSFLSHAIASLDLRNAEALWMDVRDLAGAQARFADVATLRAVAETEEALALADGVLRLDGVALLWQTATQFAREATPPGWSVRWAATPSRDEIERGIRVCILTKGLDLR